MTRNKKKVKNQKNPRVPRGSDVRTLMVEDDEKASGCYVISNTINN
jgi:hypothetical protein